MCSEIPVTEVEPRGSAHGGHHVAALKGVTRASPAAAGIQQSREFVADCIDIRGDVKPPPFEVITSVDNDGYAAGGNYPYEPADELGGASPTGEYDDLHRRSSGERERSENRNCVEEAS